MNNKICKKCILECKSEESDLCENCSEHEGHKNILEDRLVALKVKKTLRELQMNKQKGKYDIAVAFSGGKDSSYLLYVLKEHYKLNVLAISALHPLVGDLARKNMQEVTKKLDIDWLGFEIDKKMYKKLIRYATLNCGGYGKNFYVCSVCGFLQLIVVYNLTMQKKILFLATALDKSQAPQGITISNDVKNFFNNYYEKSKTADVFMNVLGDKVENTIYDINLYKKFNKRPSVVDPLYIADIKSPYEIRKKLNDLNILKIENSDPKLTNCTATSLFNYYIYKKSDKDIYRKFVAQEIRTDYRGYFLEEWFLDGEKTRKKYKYSWDKENILKAIKEVEKVVEAIASDKKDNKYYFDLLSKKYSFLFNFIGKKSFYSLIDYQYEMYHYRDVFNIDWRKV